MRRFYIALSLIYGGIGGGVDHRIRRMGIDRSGAGGGVGQICISTRKGGDLDIIAVQRAKFRRHLTAVAEDENLHALPNRSPTP